MKETTRKKLTEKEVHIPSLHGLVKIGDFHSFKSTLDGVIDDGSIHELYADLEEEFVHRFEEKFLNFKGKLDEAGYY